MDYFYAGQVREFHSCQLVADVCGRRISVFHGKHVTIMRSNLPTLMPFGSVEVSICGRVDTLQNTTAMVHLTNMLEDARDAMSVTLSSSHYFLLIQL